MILVFNFIFDILTVVVLILTTCVLFVTFCGIFVGRPCILDNKALSSTAKIENVDKKVEKKDASAVAYRNPCTVRRLYHKRIRINSTHRDGAIYNNMDLKRDYRGVDLTDHNESM